MSQRLTATMSANASTPSSPPTTTPTTSIGEATTTKVMSNSASLSATVVETSSGVDARAWLPYVLGGGGVLLLLIAGGVLIALSMRRRADSSSSSSSSSYSSPSSSSSPLPDENGYTTPDAPATLYGAVTDQSDYSLASTSRDANDYDLIPPPTEIYN
jgi:hypothetical protein